MSRRTEDMAAGLGPVGAEAWVWMTGSRRMRVVRRRGCMSERFTSMAPPRL